MLIYLGQSCFSKSHTKLLKGVVFSVHESETKYLNFLKEQVVRTTESQDLKAKEPSVKEFVVKN